MPWCDDCAKFWNPASMPEDGTCPTCRRTLVDTHASRERRDSGDQPAATPAPAAARAAMPGKADNPYDIDVKALAGESGKAPWHFKLLVIAIIAYLAWRVVQVIGWLIH